MQKPNWLKNFATLLLISTLSLVVVTPVIAQSNSASSPKTQTVSVSEDFLKAVDLALLELEGLRKLKKLSDQQATEYQDKITVLQAAYDVQAKQLALSEQATGASIEAYATQKQALDKARDVINDYTTELAKVRVQRDKARSWLWKVGAAGLVIGVVVGVLVGGSRQ